MSRRTRLTAVVNPVITLVAALVAALAIGSTVVGALPSAAEPMSDRAAPARPADAARLDRAGPEPTLRARAQRDGDSTTRRITVQWKGAPERSRYSRSTRIPGIGRLTLTCRPDETRISLSATDRDNETQLWMAKYEDKPYGRAVAVKTTRIYRYANAYDDGSGGTGNPQHEGLNQRGGPDGVENYAKGYGHGIISQRGSRNVAVGADAPEPVTTFDVNWYWNGFDHPPRFRSCKIDMVLVTRAARVGLSWHGEDDARDHDYRRVRIADLGHLELRCEPGRFGRRSVALVPDDDTTRAYVETIEGEGRVEDHVETRNRVTDRETGRLGPITLPTNGMMRLYFDTGRTTFPFIVSSLQKVNDPHPRLNSCEIAMGAFPR